MTTASKQYLIALLAGALLPFAFAPFHWSFLAIISPVLLLLSWQRTTPKRAALSGLLFGLGCFGIGVSWIFLSMRMYGNMSVPLAVLVTLLFITGLALFPALQGYLLTRYFPKDNFKKALLIFPLSWLLIEYLRGSLFTGFPWLLIGYSQLDTPLSGFAPLVGVYGVSWISVLTSAALFILWQKRLCYPRYLLATPAIALLLVPALWLSGCFLTTVQWTQPSTKTLQATLVQGNIPEILKWDHRYRVPIIKRYQALTQAHLNSDLIIWPEAALPVYRRQVAPYLTQLSAMLKDAHTTLLAGAPLADDDNHFYNGLISLGLGEHDYKKRHLVPFGEYTPLHYLLNPLIKNFNIPMSDFSPGPSQQPPVLANQVSIAPFICYEIAYPKLVAQSAKKAELLVTITDDSWFGHSIAAAQHLQIAQMRALETGRYLLFSANNGITAVINDHGKIIKKIPPYEQNTLTASNIQLMHGNTPLTLLLIGVSLTPWT